MKQYILSAIALVALVTLPFSACKKGLDYTPKYGLNSATVYDDPENYVHVLAKIYGSFVLTGNQGPAGQPDITGFDEGASGLIRVLWNLQELPTDEAVCGWTDAGIPELNNMTWSSDNVWVKYMYYRIYFTVPMCNEFIRESSDSKLSERGFSDSEKNKIKAYRTEARFIRALAYYYLVDMFGGGPFVTEDDEPGAFNPEYGTRKQIFDYVESELLAIENEITPARQNEYARADRAAVQTLLARLYLNAEVYTGQARYADVISNCEKVISSGYAVNGTPYQRNFLADNHTSNEIIFSIAADGRNTQTYGCTSFIIHAAIGGKMSAGDFGVNSGWAGLRTTKNLVNLFDTIDGRFLFFKKGQNLEIDTITNNFPDGYGVTKFKNITSTGAVGSDPTKNFVDTDFPLFRLADVYLMYAEAVLRGGGGNLGTAIGYVNTLRERAFGNSSQNVAGIDLNFILDERARELYWEGVRRTDLIRYGRFTDGSYLWPFKGGVVTGTGVGSFLNIYPIPNSDINANPNLSQNPGY